jgi:hypothetical protein
MAAESAYVFIMRPKLVFAMVVACMVAGPPAAAQFQPPPPALENRIPAPLPPPPQPPVIDGPLGKSPPAGVHLPRRLDTFGDRASRCLQRGANAGLRGAELDAYTRECTNAD